MSIDTAVDKLVDAIEKFSAPAAEIAREAARMEAYSTLAYGTLSVVVFAASAYALKKCIKMMEVDDIWMLGAIFSGIIALISFCAGVSAFLDPWTWATISKPELWLAKKALGL